MLGWPAAAAALLVVLLGAGPPENRMKTIGVIGGLGPQATMDFEARVHRSPSNASRSA